MDLVTIRSIRIILYFALFRSCAYIYPFKFAVDSWCTGSIVFCNCIHRVKQYYTPFRRDETAQSHMLNEIQRQRLEALFTIYTEKNRLHLEYDRVVFFLNSLWNIKCVSEYGWGVQIQMDKLYRDVSLYCCRDP